MNPRESSYSRAQEAAEGAWEKAWVDKISNQTNAFGGTASVNLENKAADFKVKRPGWAQETVQVQVQMGEQVDDRQLSRLC